MMGWNQPICREDWDRLHPDRPVPKSRGESGARETCAYCGKPTNSGIYLRANPETVPFPARDD